MDYKKSLEEIEKALIELREENKKIPVIVEGEKDIEALKKLGVTGVIYKDIIILTDWDKKGGFLCSTIRRNLQGRVFCNTYYREIFAKSSMIKTVEGLPSWVMTMNEKIRNYKMD